MTTESDRNIGLSDEDLAEIDRHCRQFQALNGVGRQRGCWGCEAGEAECWSHYCETVLRPKWCRWHRYQLSGKHSDMTGWLKHRAFKRLEGSCRRSRKPILLKVIFDVSKMNLEEAEQFADSLFNQFLDSGKPFHSTELIIDDEDGVESK